MHVVRCGCVGLWYSFGGDRSVWMLRYDTETSVYFEL